MRRVSRCVFEHVSGWVHGLACVCVFAGGGVPGGFSRGAVQ